MTDCDDNRVWYMTDPKEPLILTNLTVGLDINGNKVIQVGFPTEKEPPDRYAVEVKFNCTDMPRTKNDN